MDQDPTPDTAFFVLDLQDANKNLFFCLEFFCILLFEGTFTSFFEDKKCHKEITKQQESMLFSLFLLDD
jgi:hypothetical protein